MPWQSSVPTDNWQPREIFVFLRELSTRIKFATVSVTVGLVGANSGVHVDVTAAVCTGLRPGMPIALSPPTGIADGIAVFATCPANDTLRVHAVNATGSPVTLAASTWAFMGIVT